MPRLTQNLTGGSIRVSSGGSGEGFPLQSEPRLPVSSFISGHCVQPTSDQDKNKYHASN